MIPFSTAVWDPKWYHEGQGQNHLYFDKRSVINGLRVPMLVPPVELHGLCHGSADCLATVRNCAYLERYYNYLETIDRSAVCKWLETACEKIRLRNGFCGDPVAVLMVHESPENKCSERLALYKWLLDLPGFVGEVM